MFNLFFHFSLQLLRNNDGVRDVGGSGLEVDVGERGDSGERGEREKVLEEEIGSLRDKLGHLQDECTQVSQQASNLCMLHELFPLHRQKLSVLLSGPWWRNAMPSSPP